MSQKIYQNILKSGLFLAFISFFLVKTNLLFPYITSKQIYFNILIEILVVFWAAYLVKYPEYLPKKSWITCGLAAFFLAVLVTCFTGVDFNLSFWGDIERMLGWFHLIHFFFYYLIMITVMREKKDWLLFFHASVIAAVMISLYTFKIKHATIGNTAYVAGYLLFNIYFAAFLFANVKNWAARALYVPAIILMLVAFWREYNSGSLIGLALSVLLVFFLAGVLNKDRKIKIITLSVFAVSVLAVVLLFANKQSDFVKNNGILSTVTSMVSSNKITFQTRLISWKAAYLDFPNHPMLGTGYGNYAITFDKFFDPLFFNYMRSETYFDHAHNNLIDIATTTGLLGLLTYLSIFAAAGYYLVSGYRQRKIDLTNFLLITGLIVAYFIENLAIFDSLVTYVSIMMTLGYIYWLNNQERVEVKEKYGADNKEVYVLLGVGLVIFAIMYQYNIKVYKMLDKTIDGQRIMGTTGDIVQTTEAYKTALSYNTPLDRDSRSTFTRLLTQGQAALNSVKDRQKGQEVLDYGIHLAEQNLALSPHDSLQLMELSQLYSVAANYNADNQQKASYYLGLAEDAINKSIDASPRRIPIFFAKAQIYLTVGKKDDAIATIKYAISLNEKYPDGYCQLAKLDLYYKNDQEGYEAMDKCIDLGGTDNLYPTNFIKSLINYYGLKKDWPRTVALYERYTRVEPNDVSGWINLAKLYKEVGKNAQAIAAAKRAMTLDPSIKDGAEEFINNLQK